MLFLNVAMELVDIFQWSWCIEAVDSIVRGAMFCLLETTWSNGLAREECKVGYTEGGKQRPTCGRICYKVWVYFIQYHFIKIP